MLLGERELNSIAGLARRSFLCWTNSNYQPHGKNKCLVDIDEILRCHLGTLEQIILTNQKLEIPPSPRGALCPKAGDYTKSYQPTDSYILKDHMEMALETHIASCIVRTGI